MGEVYRATDTKLGREVAIKVLPTEVARDPERLARFQREATLLAALNHPRIAAIHGLEEEAGDPFLVLELVEGEDLAERLKRGPIPIDEALDIARQIAEALEEAHDRGIVHRDLKPANVKVTPDGKVKVLDFGLAKAWEGDTAAGSSSDLSRSPTLAHSGTQAGIILGTAAYMSPEQARGKPVDRRADIWAFGVVLFEMLTGRRGFAGEDLTDTLAAVVRSEPPWDALPDTLSPTLRVYLRRCLHKDPKQRVGDIRDVRLALEGAFETTAATQLAVAAGAQPVWRQRLPVAATAGIVTVLGCGLVGWSLWPTAIVPRVTRLTMAQPDAQPLSLGNSSTVLALSPDGTRAVYRIRVEGQPALVVRALDSLDATVLYQGNAFTPFFSPDGAWVGFEHQSPGRTLKRVPVTGGPALAISALESRLNGATWGEDDTIIFGTGTSSGLWQVPAGGGTPEPMTTLDEAQGESNHEWPELLPGGEAVLFTIRHAGDNADAAQIAVRHLGTGEQRVLVSGGSYPMYVPTGHLVYATAGTLRAVPFDLDRLAATGIPVGVLEGVLTKARSGAADVAVARDGSLIYVAGEASETLHSLVWVDREGREEPVAAEPRSYRDPAVSPDGTRVAVTVQSPENTDVWIWNLGRETLQRLTFDEGSDTHPIWTPEGSRLVFDSSREGGGLFWKAADGTGEIERLMESPDAGAFSWGAEGQLVFNEGGAVGGRNISTLTLDGDRHREVLLDSEFGQRRPAVSPDGRWLAYESKESGQWQIYVRPFPHVDDGKWQISTDGGREADWAPDGQELFYLGPTHLMVAEIETEPTFSWSSPESVFDAAGYLPNITARTYDIHPDGQRFLMIKPATAATTDGEDSPQLIFVQNWFEELKRLAPTD